MITKKHMTALADAIYHLAGTTADPTQAVDIAVRDHADLVADIIEADNPRFDREKFLTACGF